MVGRMMRRIEGLEKTVMLKDHFISHLHHQNDQLRNALIDVMNYARVNGTADVPALTHIERMALDALTGQYGKPKL